MGLLSLDRVLSNRGIDLCKQLAFLDLIADIDKQLFQLPGHLGANLDHFFGSKGAGSRNRDFEIAFPRGGSFIGWCCRGGQIGSGEPDGPADGQ